MKVCKVCGATSNETKIYGDVCRKHYLQFKRHGRYLERTIYDPNRFILEGDIVKIELYNTSGDVTGYGIIDAEDLHLVKDIKWYLKQGYVRGTLSGKKIFLHRIIRYVSRGKVIDHVDGNPLNNRKENLRECSQHENTMNRGRNKIAGVKRVPSGRFQAVITYKYKSIYLGTFETEEEAIEARLDAEKKYFGDYRPR